MRLGKIQIQRGFAEWGGECERDGQRDWSMLEGECSRKVLGSNLAPEEIRVLGKKTGSGVEHAWANRRGVLVGRHRNGIDGV